MKIVCTLKEFELLCARCPMNNFLMDDDKCEEMLKNCHINCILSSFCLYGKDGGANFTLADLVKIEQ